MKVKVTKTKLGIILDYFKAKNPNEIRKNILNYLATTAKCNLIFIVDTNVSKQKLNIDIIKEILDRLCDEYSIEATMNTGRKTFGLASIFGSRKKPKMDENIIIMKVSKERFDQELYDSFLRYYDYGVSIDVSMSTNEMLKASSGELDELLFNKDILKVTFYDSQLFARLRTDSEDADVEKYLRTIQ